MNISITLTTTIAVAKLMMTLIIKDSSDDKHDFGDKNDNDNSRKIRPKTTMTTIWLLKTSQSWKYW